MDYRQNAIQFLHQSKQQNLLKVILDVNDRLHLIPWINQYQKYSNTLLLTTDTAKRYLDALYNRKGKGSPRYLAAVQTLQPKQLIHVFDCSNGRFYTCQEFKESLINFLESQNNLLTNKQLDANIQSR